jgi:hypothetical protein
VTIRFDEQVRLIGGRTTVIRKEQFVKPPHGSLAVQVTELVPMGNVLPLGGLHITVGLHPPVAVLVKNTTAPFELVAVTVRFDEHVRSGGGRNTLIVKLQLVLWPHPSLAMHETLVVPIGNVLPLGGLQLRNGGGVQPPEAELL